MTVRASRLLGWRKFGGRGEHRLGISKNLAVSDGIGADPIIVTHDTSRETESILAAASCRKTVDSLLLKRAQMSE